jgi:hypothetical protein
MRTYKPTGRPRGAPPGNTHALKHGIYSAHISASEQEALEPMPPDQNQVELALARVRLKTCLEKQGNCEPSQWMDYERMISCYLRLIVSLTHKNALLGRDQHAAYITVMEMIQQVNEEQDVS